MSFQTTALKYGWTYLTALGVLGLVGTIYTLYPTRHQVAVEDFIEAYVGTDERIMALQTADGTYPVARLALVQSWMKTNALVANGAAYKVCYTSYWPSTSGVGATISYTSSVQPSINYASSWTATNGWTWTNVSAWPSMTVTGSYEVMTNLIGWLPDMGYMVSLGDKIKEVVPYYEDASLSSPTNIVMLTVTGLFSSLHIGDFTNQFTKTPCWTNPVSTNWVVNYTSYWPSTSGVPVTNRYTSDYQQVVNWAYAWTNSVATNNFYDTNSVLTNTTYATNWFHLWTNGSNWASSVVTITNATSYGSNSWQDYAVVLQEYYKVLNALQVASNSYMWCSNQTIYVWKDVPAVGIPGLSPRWRGIEDGAGVGWWGGASWGDVTSSLTAAFGGGPPSGTHNTNSSDGPVSFTHGEAQYDPYSGWGIRAAAVAGAGVYEIGPFPTNQTHSAVVRARSVAYGQGWTAAGAIGAQDVWANIIDKTNSSAVWEYSGSYGGNAMPAWCDYSGATGNVNQVTYSVQYSTNGIVVSHWTRNADEATNAAFGSNYVFYYCTNKWW